MSTSKRSRDDNKDNTFQEEKALIERIKSGDTNAYGILVVRYQHRLLQFLYKKFGQHHMVEDTVQIAFIKAFERIETFQYKSKFFTWLCTIAIREMINTVVDEQKRPAILADSTLTDGETSYFATISDDSMTIEEEIIEEERIRQLHELTHKVPKKLLEPLLMSTKEGLSYKEIAERLNVTVDSVRSRINRARVELKALLAESDLEL